MATTVSKRNKYVRGMTATWWKDSAFYRFYMLREATALPTIWFCIVLLYSVICLSKYNGFVGVINFISFLQNPLVIILNLVSLAGLLLHAFTLFDMTGEVMAGSTGLPAKVIKTTLRITFAVVTLLALILVAI